MQTLLSLIAITTIWCLTIKIVTEEGMILERVGAWAKKKVDEGNIIFEPLLVCEFCLSSIHTAIGFAFAFGLDILPFVWDIKLILLYVLCAGGTSVCCGTIWNVLMVIIEKRKYYSSLSQPIEEKLIKAKEDVEY